MVVYPCGPLENEEYKEQLRVLRYRIVNLKELNAWYKTELHWPLVGDTHRETIAINLKDIAKYEKRIAEMNALIAEGKMGKPSKCKASASASA